ncbi:MAG: hypothetical protein JHC86_03390 [Ilumatobacteraceae bacterium]|nr:hypothetical protein [Ilumatobacteraceae bacterium]
MTIEKGVPWGSTSQTPADVVVVPDEATAAQAVSRGEQCVVLQSGDLIRALGGRAAITPQRGSACRLLPCDVLRITLDDTTQITAVSSIVVGSWRHPRWWVTSGGFLGALNVAPRAHPNDGLADALTFGDGLVLRQLVAIRRRMKLGDHLPHPLLTMQRAGEVQWQHAQPATVTIDGQRMGRVRSVRVVVQPDAFSLCVPV